jgi:hypothetical protein
MAKTDAERAREYRRRKRDAALGEVRDAVTDALEKRHETVTQNECDAPSVTHPNTIAEQVERDIHEPVGPLDVYSESRWSYLQSRGHVWDADRQRSFRPAEHGTRVMGVTVPGDPAYDGIVDRAKLQAEASEHLEVGQ